MIDENINYKPYKNGERLIIEVVITDEDKSFDFLGGALFNRISTENMGFDIDKVCFWKDRYIDNIPVELRSEIIDKLQKSIDEIRNLVEIY